MKLKLLVLLLWAGAAHAQDSLTLELNHYLKKNDLPGFAVVITNHKKIVYEQGFGYADVAKKIPYMPNTIQNVGSVSKTFIAVALMKAIELQYFTLETDINTILPFKINRKITIRDLATHTSGIKDIDSIYHRSYRFKGTATDPQLSKIMIQQHYTSDLPDTTLAGFMKTYLTDPQHYNQANHYAYSNIGAALAAYLIELKAHQSFAQFTQRYIFTPLKMKNTAWFLTQTNAVPYLNPQTPFPYYTLTTYPDGGLRTSANELASYLLNMIQPTILSPASARIMLTPYLQLANRSKAIFWNHYNDGYTGHDGDDPGATAQILFNDHSGIIFTCNQYIPDTTALLKILKKYAEQLPRK